MSKKTEKQPKKNQPKPPKSNGIAKTQPSATALSEIEAAAAQPKYYTNFDFFYKRTSFRTMALFFKTAFAPFLEKWKLVKKSKDVGVFLENFIESVFPGLIKSMTSEAARFDFQELVKLLLFSHRHNKNDAYLSNPPVPFSLVRGPMYQYSKQAQEEFLDLPAYSFLFLWFRHSPEALKFAWDNHALNPDPEHPARMAQEIEFLGRDAGERLTKAAYAMTKPIAQDSEGLKAQSRLQQAEHLQKYLNSAI